VLPDKTPGPDVATAAPCLSIRISARKRDNIDNNYEKTLVSAFKVVSKQKERERKRERQKSTPIVARGKEKKKPEEGIFVSIGEW